MEKADQLLEKEGEKAVKMRVSREGGLEHLVRELYLGDKFVLSFPVDIRLNEDESELCFTFSMNIGTEPHPGLHFSAAFDVPVKLPEKPKEVEEEPAGSAVQAPPPSPKEQLRKEIIDAGGNPDDVIVPEMTDQKAKEILDALQGPAA